MNINIKSILRLTVTAALLIICGCSTYVGSPKKLPPNAIKPTIAVTEFENRAGIRGDWQLGSGMADLLVAELIASDNFVVIERKQLANILGEHALQKLPQFREEGKTRFGRLVHSRYLIRGVVNDFSENSRFSIFAGITHFFTSWSVSKARVSMTLTVISVETGEILESISCAANVRTYFAAAGGQEKNVTFGGDAFFKTPLGEATSLAIRQGVNELTEKIPTTYWQPVIAQATSNGIIINGGENYELKVGDKFTARGEPSYITDPLTGDVLNIVPGAILAEIQIIKVDDKISYAKIINGDTSLKRGNLLEYKNPPNAPKRKYLSDKSNN
jgi:curli biogenesis system outer membrane secretion channel CsgG